MTKSLNYYVSTYLVTFTSLFEANALYPIIDFVRAKLSLNCCSFFHYFDIILVFVGIKKLLTDNIYDAAFPLHEVRFNNDRNNELIITIMKIIIITIMKIIIIIIIIMIIIIIIISKIMVITIFIL